MDEEARPIISDTAPPQWWRFRRPGRVVYRYGDGEEANTLVGYLRSLFPEGGVWVTEVSDPDLARRLGDAAGLLGPAEISSELDSLEEGLTLCPLGDMPQSECRDLKLRIVAMFRAKRIAPRAAWQSWKHLIQIYHDIEKCKKRSEGEPIAEAWSEARYALDWKASSIKLPRTGECELRFEERRDGREGDHL